MKNTGRPDENITSSDSSAMNEAFGLIDVSHLLPSKELLKPLFKDFFTYHNEANKDAKVVDEYFDTWYNWKVLGNSNLDEPLTEW